MKYINRTTKKNRQELLEIALKQELQYLRKKCFPWQRREFLFDDIQIAEKSFEYSEEGRTLGLYEFDEKNFIHRIWVDKTYILGAQKVKAAWIRRQYYKDIRQIIRHELTHAFTQERWEYKCKNYISNKSGDASPIFLSILSFVNGYTGHKCWGGFEKTDLYKTISQFKTYNELQNYLNDYLLEFMEVIQQIKEISNKEKFIKQEEVNYLQIQNNFEFAPRANGLTKFMEITALDYYKKDNKDFRHYNCCSRTWHIGCNITASMLLQLYNKKKDNKATYYNTKKQLIIMDQCAEVKDLRTITIKEEKNF